MFLWRKSEKKMIQEVNDEKESGYMSVEETVSVVVGLSLEEEPERGV